VLESARAIARYRLAEDAHICNLDDPGQLLALGLRPSDVVSRDYTRCRQWARHIYETRRYEQGGWVGVRWWSYYESFGTSGGKPHNRTPRFRSVGREFQHRP
jgi:hypothetical protein